MPSVNTTATHKFVVVLNEKSPAGKLLSAAGQIAMSLHSNATEEQRVNMSFVPSLCSPLETPSGIAFVILYI